MGSETSKVAEALVKAQDRISELEATERELREALKVLAEELHSKALDRAVGKHWDAEINDAVWENPIAEAAVREAGR